VSNPIKPLKKIDVLVVRLTIVDSDGNPIDKPFCLQQGPNVFKCIAEYVDGSIVPYEPYWTCPILYRTGGADLWGVFGRGRRASVTVHASLRQERYTEIACWVFPPDEDHRSGRIVDSTGFDYSIIDRIGT
jgi:hypothetical protein